MKNVLKADMIPELIESRTVYNSTYKKFLSFSRYFESIYSTEYTDLFSASTFSKVVPELIGKTDYDITVDGLNSFYSYPASFGIEELIVAFQGFIKKTYDVDIKEEQILVCPGSIQAIDGLSRAMSGKVIFLPALTVSFARVIPIANGSKLVSIKIDEYGRLDVNDFKNKLMQYPKSDYKYLYLNYPGNPTGAQLTLDEFSEIVKIAQEFELPIIHDHDICFTSHKSERPVLSIFQVSGAIENSVEIYTFSKEFGLSGLRVALVLGNQSLINLLQFHNYELSVMTPVFNQMLAIRALNKINPEMVSRKIRDVMEALINGFKELGWKDLNSPDAGISFLLPAPITFQNEYGDQSGEIFSFYLQKYCGVGVGPAIANGESGAKFIRVLSMAPVDEIEKMFSRLKRAFISPEMDLPTDLMQIYEAYSNNIEENYSR